MRTRVRREAAAIPAVLFGVAVLAGCGSSANSPSAAAGAASGPSTSSAAVAPVAASAGATSASPTATGANGDFDSCSVVTQAEAANAIGESVTAGVLGTATVEGGLACVFYGPQAPAPHDPNVAQPDSVRVVVVEGADAQTWYNDYKSSSMVNAQAISGYGDQAYYDGYASLSVMKGDFYVRIAIQPAGAAPSLSAEEELANAILPNL